MQSGENINYVYFVHREGITPVIRSQVLHPLSILKREFGFRCQVICSLPFGHWIRPSMRAQMSRSKLEVSKDFDLPISYFPTSRKSESHFQCNSFLLRKLLSRQMREPTIIHARNCLGTQVALNAVEFLGIPVVYDCRGAEPAEYLQRVHSIEDHDRQSVGVVDANTLRSEKWITKAESRAAMGSTAWTCVSHKIEKYLA